LNKQLILRLRSKSQQAKYNKRNKDIYNQFLKSVSQVPASTTKCSANECCTDQKVNVKIKADVLALISKQYKLYLEIRKQVPKYGKPGVPCTRPKAECDRDKNKYESLLKWLDKRARQIRANELVLTKEIPLSDSECRDIYAS